jgi:hypothetical protein
MLDLCMCQTDGCRVHICRYTICIHTNTHTNYIICVFFQEEALQLPRQESLCVLSRSTPLTVSIL